MVCPLGTTMVVEAGATAADWPHEVHPLDPWYTAWLTAPPLQDEQPEQELHEVPQSLQPHTGRIVTCWVHELHGDAHVVHGE
jgi:hypothetical protein